MVLIVIGIIMLMLNNRTYDEFKNSDDVRDVEAEVVANAKAKKVIVYKYKRKTGYHNKNGHRQQYTEVEIKKINA